MLGWCQRVISALDRRVRPLKMLVEGGLRQMSVPGSACKVKVLDAILVSLSGKVGLEFKEGQRGDSRVELAFLYLEEGHVVVTVSGPLNWGCKMCPLGQLLPAAKCHIGHRIR